MPTQPAPSPSDSAAFDDWARASTDSWKRIDVYEEVERAWATASTPDERALLAAWGAPVGIAPLEDLEALAQDTSVDPVLQGRVKAALAQTTVGVDGERASTLVAEARALVDDASVPVRTRLTVALAAAEVYLHAGRPGDAMAALDAAGTELKSASGGPAWTLLAIDVERLTIAGRSGQDRQEIAQSAHQVASAALALPTEPATIDVALKAAEMLINVGAFKPAEGHLETVVDRIADITEARAARYQALLSLADTTHRIEGPEAAMAIQRDAIAAVESLGDTPMLGWAQRGLALLLVAADRLGEATEAFEVAAGVHERLGMSADASALRLEQADAMLHADDPEGAAALTEEVAEAVAELPDPPRVALEMRLHQVFAQLAAYEGELESAAEHWVEVADRAPGAGASPLDPLLTAAQLFASADAMDQASAQFIRAELAAADAPDPAQATALVMRTHAETLRQVGRADEAAELARVAANHARTSGDEGQAIYLSVIAADSLHDAGESQAALQLYGETIEAARTAEMPSLLAAVHAAHANVLRDMGREAEAAEAEAAAAALGISPEGSEKLPG